MDEWIETESFWTKQIIISDNLSAKMVVYPNSGIAEGFIIEKTLTPTGEVSLKFLNRVRYAFRSHEHDRDSLRLCMKGIENLTLSCI